MRVLADAKDGGLLAALGDALEEYRRVAGARGVALVRRRVKGGDPGVLARTRGGEDAPLDAEFVAVFVPPVEALGARPVESEPSVLCPWVQTIAEGEEGDGCIVVLGAPSRPSADGWAVALGAALAMAGIRLLAVESRDRANARFRLLAEVGFDAVFIHDGVHILEVNETAPTLVGWTRAELLKMPITDLILADDLAAIRARIANGETAPIESRIRCRDGGSIPVEARTGAAIEDGRPVRVVAIHDLRRQMEVQALLREASDRMRGLLELAYEGIVVHKGGRVVWTNQGFADMVGYPIEEVLGMVPGAVTTAESAAMIGQKIRARENSAYVVTGVRANGSEFPMLIQGLECDWQGEPARITGFRDLTRERREAERRNELERRVLEAQRLESLSVLAGGLAHDLNNLLVGVLGNADLICEELPCGSVGRTRASAIAATVRRAVDLTEGLLAYSGRGRLELRPLDIGTLVRETVDLLRTVVPALVDLSVHGEARVTVLGDPLQFRLLFRAIVRNAVEAYGERGGMVEVRMTVVAVDSTLPSLVGEVALRPGPHVRVDVCDEGHGIDPGAIHRIFEPFFTTRFTGRGLGLPASLGVARAAGGGRRDRR